MRVWQRVLFQSFFAAASPLACPTHITYCSADPSILSLKLRCPLENQWLKVSIFLLGLKALTAYFQGRNGFEFQGGSLDHIYLQLFILMKFTSEVFGSYDFSKAYPFSHNHGSVDNGGLEDDWLVSFCGPFFH